MSVFHFRKPFNKIKVLQAQMTLSYILVVLIAMKKIWSIVTHRGLEIGGKGLWSLTYRQVQASHIKTSLKMDHVYIVHGYFQLLLCT